MRANQLWDFLAQRIRKERCRDLSSEPHGPEPCNQDRRMGHPERFLGGRKVVKYCDSGITR
jgi:hypothetical protein